MRFPRKRGATSVMVRIFIPDNSSTTGAGLTGLTSSSTNLSIGYCRELDSSFTAYSGANIETITTIGTYQAPSSSSKIRFKAVDATNAPGLYELHFHNSATAFGSGDASRNVIINILETSTSALHIGPNMVLIPLSAYDVSEGESNTVAMATDTVTASAIAADAIGSSELAASAANEIADAILTRNASNVEASAGEHTLCTVILAMLENSISGTTLTIKRTDGSTTHVTKTLTVNASADPITGIT